MTPRDDGAGGKPVRLLSARGFHIDTQFISESPRTRYDQHHTLVSPNRTVGKKRFPIFRVTDVGGERLLCHGIHLTIDRSIDVKKKRNLLDTRIAPRWPVRSDEQSVSCLCTAGIETETRPEAGSYPSQEQGKLNVAYLSELWVRKMAAEASGSAKR